MRILNFSTIPSWVLFWGWLAGGVGCVSTPPPSRIIYQDPNRFVRLEVIYRSGVNEHNHPATISSTNLATILKEPTVSLRPVRPQRGPFAYEKGRDLDEPSQLFSNENIDFFSQHFARALERATPAEDVMFFLNQPEDRETSEITSGSMFVEGEQLHILFANYRHRTVGNSEIQKVQANPLEVLGKPMYDLTAGPFGKTYGAEGLTVILTGTPQHLVIDYLSLLGTQGIAKEERQISPEERLSPGKSVAEKLQELDEMRQKRLITEEEFQNVRSKLLESF